MIQKSLLMNRYFFFYTTFIFFLLAFAFLQIPSSDDYCLFNKAQENGAIGLALKAYKEWSGRFLIHLTLGFWISLFGIVNIQFVSMLNYMFLIILTFVLTKIIFHSSEKTVFSWSFFAPWVLLTSTLLIGMREALSQIVAWPTGGIVYIFPIAFFFLCIYIISQKKKITLLDILLVSLSSFLLELFNPILFLFVLWKIRSDRKIHNKISSFAVTLAIAFCIVSILFYFAPGNFARAKTSMEISLDTVIKLFENYFYLFYKTLRYVWPGTVLAILSSYLLSAQRITIKETYKPFKLHVVFLIAVAVALLPLTLVKDFYNIRPSSFIVILIIISTFSWTIQFLSSRPIKLSIEKSRRIIYGLYVFLCLMILVDTYRMSQHRQLWKKRHELLTTKANEHVIVESLKDKSFKAMHLDDLGSKNDHWINRCMAEYYSLKSIQSKE